MNSSTHAPWLDSSTNKDNSDNSNRMKALPGAIVRIHNDFGYERRWNFRSSTGFTALGVSRVPSSAADIAANTPPARGMNGVLFQVPSSMMSGFDKREIGYHKVQIPLEYIEFVEEMKPTIASPHKPTFPELSKSDKIWIYAPQASQCREADENHPLLQSYVDTVLQGCLEWGGEAMAEEFVLSTGGWSAYFLNDTPSSRRPWLFRKDYDIIDSILRKQSALTRYEDRRHPEEFASTFLMIQKMRGLWSLPRRNRHFTGRRGFLGQIHAKLQNKDCSVTGGVTYLFVQGMGGVGKSSICVEYCYRNFPSSYGLIVWLNAESTDALVADYRQLLADLADGADINSHTASSASSKDNTDNNSTDEIIAEVKTRLFRCQVPWLLVFDNLEDRKLLGKFVPRGAASGSTGHVLITSRVVDMESGSGSSSLNLGCLSPEESLELLRRSLEASNSDIGDDVNNLSAAKDICQRLGHLPLALGMAAAYMQRCDISCLEYRDRYVSSEQRGKSLLRHEAGKVLDYSLTVFASLSLSLNAIQKESETASAVMKFLCWLGPDQITKSLLRGLLVAKRKADKEQKATPAQVAINLGDSSRWAILGGICVAAAGCRPFFNGSTSKLRSKATIATAVVLSVISTLVLSRLPSASISEPSSHRSSNERLAVDEFEQSDLVWQILKSFSILTVRDGKTGSLHRLLAQSLRSTQSEEESCYNINICIEAMEKIWQFDPKKPETWEGSLQVVEHLKSLISHVADKRRGICPMIGLRAGSLSKEAGVFSAMALNGFPEAQSSLKLALKIFESSSLRQSKVDNSKLLKLKAETLHELGRVLRYQGNFKESEETLLEALSVRNGLAKTDYRANHFVADTLHELGVLEVKKHSLTTAEQYLTEALVLRRTLDEDQDDIDGDCASTLHQLAAVHVVRKPPLLDKAEALLKDSLRLSRQVGQRAATLKLLARVTIRQGLLDTAESYLRKALELYIELYGERTNHINVAAVKFQQGALATQREQLDAAWVHFSECLRMRRAVYAYAKSDQSGEDPIHLEVSVVLHELGCVAIAQGRYTQALKMFQSERHILENIEVSVHRERLYQARLTNLTWLRKCAKEMGDEEATARFSAERVKLKGESKAAASKLVPCQEQHPESITLQNEALRCRLAVRQYALTEKTGQKKHDKDKILQRLSILKQEIDRSRASAMKTRAQEFHDQVAGCLDTDCDSKRRSTMLEACDALR